MVKIIRGWLRAIDVKDDDILIIMDGGKYLNPNELPFRVRRSVFEILVMLPDNTVKPWLMNRTTQRQCVEAWGEETTNWIDRRLRVKLKKHKIDGEIKTAVYGFPEKTIQTQLFPRVSGLEVALKEKMKTA